jgi:hyperosmotically inducible protein
MRRHYYYSWLLSVAVAGLLMVGSSHVVRAQNTGSAAMEAQGQTAQIVQQVRKKINGLPDYDVFDWIVFKIHGNQLVLDGYASRPIIKDEAGRVVKGIAGIGSVQNDIQVLPLSPVDNQLRVAVYDKIYRNPVLSRYNGNTGGAHQLGMGMGQIAGGIVNNPPMGYHAIHIIVNNGQVALYGVVDNAGDSQLIEAQVKSIPGVFGVNNALMVGSSKSF